MSRQEKNGRKYTQEELALAYFTKGESCILAGEILFASRNGRAHNCHEILLVHGVELLLSSFLLKVDSQFANGRDIYKKFGHDYKLLFQHCEQLDEKNIFFTVKEYINFLSENFFEDTIEARYPSENRVDKLPSDTYEHFQKYLIPPIKKLFL